VLFKNNKRSDIIENTLYLYSKSRMYNNTQELCIIGCVVQNFKLA